jgi:primosomal protein N'
MPILTQLRSLGYIIAGFALVCLIAAWQLEKRAHRKASERVVELTVKLDDLAAKSKERQRETGKIITRYRDAQPIIEERVRVVEKAPLPGGCKTPPIIMGLDI